MTTGFSVFGCATCGSREIRPTNFKLGVDVEPCQCGGRWYKRPAEPEELSPGVVAFWRDRCIACPACDSLATQGYGTYTRKGGIVVHKQKCTKCGKVFTHPG